RTRALSRGLARGFRSHPPTGGLPPAEAGRRGRFAGGERAELARLPPNAGPVKASLAEIADAFLEQLQSEEGGEEVAVERAEPALAALVDPGRERLLHARSAEAVLRERKREVEFAHGA